MVAGGGRSPTEGRLEAYPSVMAPTAGSDGPKWLAQLAAAEQLEQRQAWAEMAQPVALADASAYLLR